MEARATICFLWLLTAVFCLLSPAASATTFYADNGFGDNGFDGLSKVITNGHGPKRSITSAITTASSGDVVSVAAGTYQESLWSPGIKNLTIRPKGQVTIVDYDPGQTDSDHDGIPDWWMWKYFHHPTGQASDLSRSNDDADLDGLTNYQEYLAATHPLESSSHPAVVATPTFAPDGGFLSGVTNVIIDCATEGATIHYTTNGLEPTANDAVVSAGSTVYVSHELRLNARAWKNGMTPSVVKSADFKTPSGLIAAGAYHSLMAESDGTLWAWGKNDDGQLGDGTRANRSTPVRLTGISNVWAVAAGTLHTVAADTKGIVWTWGNNVLGQLGNGTYGGQHLSPNPISGVSNIVGVAGGDLCTLAVRSEGTVWGWGRNETGQLGVGIPGDESGFSKTNLPVQAIGVTQMVAVDGGVDDSFGLRGDGKLYWWGGYATLIPSLSNVVAIAAADDWSVAVENDGSVWSSANNWSAPMSGLSNVVAVGAGGYHALAVTADGDLYGWGANDSGQLGTNTPSYSSSPLLVAGISNVVTVAAGDSHSLAVTFSQGVNLYWGWGYNGDGQVGKGTSGENEYSPTLVHFPFDADQDGLPDWQEYSLNADPLDADQNGDGYIDGVGWMQHNIPPTQMDVDGDGIPNLWERQHGLDPFNASDAGQINTHPWARGLFTNLQVYQNPGILLGENYGTFNDGIADWWRLHHFATSTATNADSCATCNPDNDYYDNLQEYQDGTDPWNGNSFWSVLVIPNAWATYTAADKIQVTATILSTNAGVTVAAAEWFLDSYAGVTFGTGSAMTATDGVFNSTSEVATNSFTPAFPTGERHLLWVHARGSDGQWCPFVKIIINPNMDDIFDEIQANYSTFGDIQFNVSFTESVNGTVANAGSAVVTMKGPYKLRFEYSTGFISIQNENRLWSYNEASFGEPVITTGLDGDFSVQANRRSDFFWDVPLSKSLNDGTITSSTNPTAFNVALSPKPGNLMPTQSLTIDRTKKFVSRVETATGDALMRSEYLNPVAVIPGHWLFTVHRHTMQFTSGDTISMESTISNIEVNQGVWDSMFDIPSE